MLEQKLLVISGKGGVGKSTVAAAMGLVAARRGLRTIVVEVGQQGRLPGLFDLQAQRPGIETKLQESLWSISIDPDTALLEWLQVLGGRISGRVLASSSTFQYFAAAAPGAKELVSMVKIWELTQKERWRGHRGGYDLVVLDAPATGHALGMLHSPRTFGAIARVGPIAAQAQRVQQLLDDPARSSYLAVAQGSEMAVTETLELQEGLDRQLGRELRAVVVNGVLPQRFTAAELRRLAHLNGDEANRAGTGGPSIGDAKPSTAAAEKAVTGSRAARSQGTDGADALTRSAERAARAVHERGRFQHNQIARLRRRGFDVLRIPFQFTAELDLPAVRRIAEHLARSL